MLYTSPHPDTIHTIPSHGATSVDGLLWSLHCCVSSLNCFQLHRFNPNNISFLLELHWVVFSCFSFLYCLKLDFGMWQSDLMAFSHFKRSSSKSFETPLQEWELKLHALKMPFQDDWTKQFQLFQRIHLCQRRSLQVFWSLYQIWKLRIKVRNESHLNYV